MLETALKDPSDHGYCVVTLPGVLGFLAKFPLNEACDGAARIEHEPANTLMHKLLNMRMLSQAEYNCEV